MQNFGYYQFGKHTVARVGGGVDRETVRELWSCFCCRAGELTLEAGEENRIAVGNASFLPLGEGEEYTVLVTPDGIGIAARDAKSLMRGLCACLVRIEMKAGDAFTVPTGEIRSAFTVANRMIHLCVFPETELFTLHRLVRLCGVLSYTHVVLEFWGMLKYDCMPELSWSHAFTKEEVAPIIREARALGMEPIPMINHLGHASSCRIDSGKHVVLDQNPSLQWMFTPDGWCWNIFTQAPRDLLRKMRAELYELFGEGSYFHIGCDEAHMYSSEYYPLDGLKNYLSDLTEEIVKEGRRPILWGDMLVPYDTNSDSEEARTAARPTEEKMRPVLNALHPQSIIADWHYETKTAPVRSSLIFKQAGFEVLGCPWDTPKNIDAHYITATEHKTDGLMMTTWHTLHTGTFAILYFARKCGFAKCDWTDHAGHRRLEVANILRKLSPEGIRYADSGFCARQLHDTFMW